MSEIKLRVALLISRSGTTAEAVIKASQNSILQKIDPVVVISSNPKAEGIKKAKALGIPTVVIFKKDFNNTEKFGERILDVLAEYKVDLVSQNGWIPMTPENVVRKYKGKIINQHPGPLDPGRPDFGGMGMYGKRVTAAVLAYHDISGENINAESTVHFIDEELDKGDIISVKPIVLRKIYSSVNFAMIKENSQTLATTTVRFQSRLLKVEHQNVIETLDAISKDKTPKFTRKGHLIPEKHYHLLHEIKKFAIELFPMG